MAYIGGKQGMPNQLHLALLSELRERATGNFGKQYFTSGSEILILTNIVTFLNNQCLYCSVFTHAFL